MVSVSTRFVCALVTETAHGSTVQKDSDRNSYLSLAMGVVAPRSLVTEAFVPLFANGVFDPTLVFHFFGFGLGQEHFGVGLVLHRD